MSFARGEREMEAATANTPVTRSAAAHRELDELRIKWTDGAIARLSDAVRPFSLIYEMDHPQHNDRDLKADAWLTIAKSVGVVHDSRLLPLFAKECERKFKNLRDEFLKTLKRPRKSAKPYKHAEKLSFLDTHSRSHGARSILYYDEATGQLADHDYGEDDADPHDMESAYAASHLNENGVVNEAGAYGEHSRGNAGQITISEVLSYSNEPSRSTMKTRSSQKNRHSQRKLVDTSGYQFVTPTLYDPHRDTMQGSSGRRAREKEMDEVDDFSNMLIKRLRRLPPDSWGVIMSRLMDTLSNAEETLKKVEVKASGSQTDE